MAAQFVCRVATSTDDQCRGCRWLLCPQSRTLLDPLAWHLPRLLPEPHTGSKADGARAVEWANSAILVHAKLARWCIRITAVDGNRSVVGVGAGAYLEANSEI